MTGISSREFTVILFATEMQLYPLTAEPSQLKAGLPVAGRPLLTYSLELLERVGFEHVLVLASSTSVQAVNDLCDLWFSSPPTPYQPDAPAMPSSSPTPSSSIPGPSTSMRRLQFSVFQVDPTLQTAEMILALKKKELLRGDLILLSCDLVLDWSSSISKLVDTHRQRNATVTVLLHQMPPLDPIKKKQRVKEEESGSASHIDYIALDPHNRLIHIAKSSDLNKGLRLSKRIIRKYPKMTISNSLLDTQCYIFAATTADFLLEHESSMKFRDIKHDLLPYLVRHQFRNRRARSDLTESQPILPPPVVDPQEYSHSPSSDSSQFKCYAVVLNGGYCQKATTIQNYVDMNRDVAAGHSELRPWEPEQSDLRFVSPSATLERTQLGPGCVVGSESALSGVTLKRSLVGKGCSFSATKGLIIDGSVIMDGVVIQCRSKVEIHGSIICSGAQILPGCNEIRNSVIGYHQVVSHSVRDTLFTQNPSENN